MRKIFPFLSAFDSYNKTDFKSDIVAGLTVGIMLIPQGMAYAMIAGLPPVYGLYAGIFPPLMYAIFGSSRQLAVGPAAMDSMLVATAIVALGVIDSGDYISTAILLATMVGLIQLLLGTLRLGFIVSFISIPVINGFIYAVALTIAVSQVGQLLGLSVTANGDIFDNLYSYSIKLSEIHFPTMTFGLGALLTIWFLKRKLPKMPFGLVVIILSVGATYFWLHDLGVSILGDVPNGLPDFKVPTFDWQSIRSLLPFAVTLSLVGFLEAFSVGKTIQRNHRKEYEIKPNRELIGLGVGNFIGSFFGAFPTTGGLSRSAVSDEAGTKSIVSTTVSAALIVVTLLFLTPLFYYLPKAALSAIIIVAVLGLINIEKIKSLWATDRHDFYLLIATFFGTLVFGIEVGILLGVILSILVLVYKTSEPHMAWLGRVEGSDHFRNLLRYDKAENNPDVAILRFDARLYFANVRALKEKVEEALLLKPSLKLFVLDAQSISDIDSTGLQGLNDLFEMLEDANVTFVMTSVIGPVRDKLKKSGFVDLVGLDHFFPSISTALEGKCDLINFQTNK